MQLTTTRTGERTHLKEEGQSHALCGVRANAVLNTQVSLKNAFDRLATCQLCRKDAGLSYWTWKGSQKIMVDRQAREGQTSR